MATRFSVFMSRSIPMSAPPSTLREGARVWVVGVDQDDLVGDLLGRIDREFRERLQRRYTELVRARKARTEHLETLAHASEPEADRSLLDRLPTLGTALASVGEDLQRRLFDAFHLEVRYRHVAHEVLITITIKEDNMPALTALTNAIADPPEGASAILKAFPCSVCPLQCAGSGHRKPMSQDIGNFNRVCLRT
ncbi:hypothetical protein FE391_16800 [Nonomuraea sp. KC401]|uniref:hypothetical protein n=1 Tax=unclassified Nonomuraea TaxID=2593643 RepID=UPI0010FECC36|nr:MULTISPECIES: hypothetical protein [unclassified Nonomuraea]NBE95265.1 hypothetical protein [Nonomuraea sp. K271]TLF72365.1 hypothetical protein FE391_16800 [Nonomuraea sp. KC401]